MRPITSASGRSRRSCSSTARPGDPAGYAGVTLTFFGLMDDDASEESVGLPLAGEPGLLVAFPPSLIHSVTPVTAGERYTVVTWFFQAP